jgi:hypothetical protein
LPEATRRRIRNNRGQRTVMETDTEPQCPPDDRPSLVEWNFSIEGGEPWRGRLKAGDGCGASLAERANIARAAGHQIYATICRAMGVDEPIGIPGVVVGETIKLHRERYPDDPK